MSAYPVFNVDYYDNFRELLLGISEKYADKPAITWYTRRGEEQTRSYAQLGQDALCFGEALCVAGLQGEHIAIASENSYEWIYAFLGITASGSVAVCVDVEQSEQAILDMILRANVKNAGGFGVGGAFAIRSAFKKRRAHCCHRKLPGNAEH